MIINLKILINYESGYISESASDTEIILKQVNIKTRKKKVYCNKPHRLKY